MAADGVELPLPVRLHGLRLPPSIPEAGWPLDPLATLAAVAVGVALATVAASLAWWWATRRRRTYRMFVALALAAPGEERRLAGLASLLRRVALARPDGTGAAPLSGADWLAWLEQRTGTGFFREGAGRVFGNALYQRPAAVDWDALARRMPGLLARLQGGRRAGLP